MVPSNLVFVYNIVYKLVGKFYGYAAILVFCPLFMDDEWFLVILYLFIMLCVNQWEKFLGYSAISSILLWMNVEW